jgi:hypothetical protein
MRVESVGVRCDAHKAYQSITESITVRPNSLLHCVAGVQQQNIFEVEKFVLQMAMVVSPN